MVTASYVFFTGCYTGRSNVATEAHHWNSRSVLKHKVSRKKSADKNYLLSDLVEVVLELVGIPMQASVLEFFFSFLSMQ